MMLKRDKKEEEDGGNPFSNLEKSSVLQEARTFNETPINPRKCGHILTKILYLINQGETIGATEATEAFFAMTKLFQSKDTTLRRLVYLGIKEMSKIANDVIIVTSSLMKDMTGKEDQFRGPSIRALCSITDQMMLQSIERYMKQAIVDKVSAVSSAALVSSMHLGRGSQDVTKRWVNEAQEAVNSDNMMVQYHALGLLYHIRKKDKLAVSRMVTKFSKHSLRSPYAYCLLIRIASKLIEEEDAGSESPMFDFIENCLRHKNEMVIYEAAHAIVNMKNTTAKDLTPAVSVLQLFCGSPKPTLRFAAVRTLNKVAMKHPAAVTACNLDLENLITDVNRSIATLAITTLLKTGNESSVDRLMKQISTFMSEISDEFKIVVVQAIRSLCSKFPRKHNVLMTFLASMLRDEGGFDYKRAIVDCIITVIEENPEAKEAGLAHLCEFIEDCEHTVLATRILHLLGREGPRTPSPSKYIRFIYNRVILENAAVRAAAVSALAKFGAHCEELLPSCIVLLERCQLDSDDEVRDRATFYTSILKQQQKSLNSAYILNGLQVSVVGLERAVHNYTLEPSDTPFDLKSVPLATQPMTEQKTVTSRETGDMGVPKSMEKPVASRIDVYAEQLSGVPELANLGPLFRSSQPVELTESETEYVIQCVKHTFSHYVVFQFDCTNTLNDQVLENVTVHMEGGDGFEVMKYVKCASLPYDKPGITYTLIRLPEEPTAVTGTFTCSLKFIVKDCDPNTGEPDDEGYEDEYVLEDVEVTVADHVQRVIKPNFGASWEEVGPENELEDTYALSSMNSLEEAVKNIVLYLGMQPCERSDKVPEGKSSHTLYLAGVFRGGHDALVRAKLALTDDSGVTMQLTVRSSDPNVSEILASAIA
ncbi:hypothetical protein LOTGIDRAFT_191967 [Lottia gigantea]|uniref:Coatomer subunit gamma n=1 Tax=Lottia gigantea TaxID=225164 RepID=V3ZH42_LOTGI|nr:hypothetical protein LOTGIDRAFT_191967 [Lottia gigantea]ESO90558.1 hypothetical protein LOTGIDRAFT_191967 [Lottia gigantea]